LIKEKTIQECLNEVRFYDELDKLRSDLNYRGLENYKSEFIYISSTRWKIFTKEEISLNNPFGYFKKAEVTEISARLRYGENQLKEIKDNGAITIYKYDGDGGLIPSHKSYEIEPQRVIFDCFCCLEGDERDGMLQRYQEYGIDFEKLIKILRKNIFWYLDYEK